MSMSARSSHKTGFWNVALLGAVDWATLAWNIPDVHKTATTIIDRTTTPFTIELVFTASPWKILDIDFALFRRSEHQEIDVIGSQRKRPGEVSTFDRNFFLT